MKMKSWLGSEFREYGAAMLSFAVLIGGSLFFLWISRGTQFHQLAIGTVMFSVTLAAALALFELCWRAGGYVARRFGLGDKD
jgi:hypothetical protein